MGREGMGGLRTGEVEKLKGNRRVLSVDFVCKQTNLKKTVDTQGLSAVTTRSYQRCVTVLGVRGTLGLCPLKEPLCCRAFSW